MKTARVGDVAEQLRGVTFAKSDAVSAPRDGYIPVLTAGNIQGGRLVTDELTYVPESRVRDKQRVKANDIVVCASSGSLRVVGKAARSHGEFTGGFGAFLKVLRPGPDVEPGYFAHFFQTPGYRRKVSHLAAGANINNLKNEHLDNLALPLPPLKEQRRIAAILDQADAIQSKRHRALAQLDDLTASIFHDMFGDPSQNVAGYPVEALAGWIVADRPITYGILKPGPHFPGGVPYVRVADMRDRGISLPGVRCTTEGIAAEYRRSRLRAGDLLMSIRGHVGRFAFVPEELDGGNITQDSARLAVRDPDAALYVRAAMESPGIQHWMARRTKGAAVKGLNLGDLKTLPLPRPPVERLHEFAALARRAERQRHLMRLASQPVDDLVASLRSSAFEGRL